MNDEANTRLAEANLRREKTEKAKKSQGEVKKADAVGRAADRRDSSTTTTPATPPVSADPVSTASLGSSASKEDVDKALDKIANDARKAAKLAGKNSVEVEQAAGRARQNAQMRRERDIATGVIT